jgi:L-aspartate oxidase
MISKGENYSDTNTYRAQGGIACQNSNESEEIFIKDILRSGGDINYLPAVEQVVKLSRPAVEDILINNLKIPFAEGKRGQLDLAMEGAHTNRRILNVKDKTGKVIMEYFFKELMKYDNLTILSSHTAVDLLSYPHHSVNPQRVFESPKVVGAYVLKDDTGAIIRIFSKKVILATGGLSSIFLHSTNPDDAVGNGIAMAYRLGARMANLEYIQFHPTSLYHHDTTHFLISEAVRGEGAKLMNRKGEYFMKKYSQLGDLAPRDIVSRAIYQEILNNNNKFVLLNIADHVKINIRERFPTIYEQCRHNNIDITRDPIPVVPAAHYSCGGILADLQGRTNILNLYAIGEVASTGVHGANRLASVSLLEGLVWGRKAADDIIATFDENKSCYTISETPKWYFPSDQETIDPALVKQDRIMIKYIMWNYSGIIRTDKRLNRAKSDLEYLHHRVLKFYQRAYLDKRIIDLRDSVQTSLLVVHAALLNKNSRGAHYIQS